MPKNSEKWLVVTEKPSVAQDLAKTLGGFEKKDSYLESETYVITWAVGHLLELLSPEEIDPKYKAWLLKDLPILPERFEYKPKDGHKARLDSIRALSKRKEIEGFINACDAGREGELIFRELYDYCEQPKPIKRIWLQSMTPQAIRKEFQHLRPGQDYDSLADAARCRAESDWLIGMNGTRAVTKRLKQRMQKGSWSVGRVQTPTLALSVKRELEILRHRPEPYWTVEGRFLATDHTYSGYWFDPQFKKPPVAEDEESVGIREKEDRIFSKDRLESILKDLDTYKSSATAQETRKESKEIAPQLFDLTTLQREANRKFGMSAARSLQAAQRLYERHKLLTYPRTDSKYLPEDYVKNCQDVLKNFGTADKNIAAISKKILVQGLLNQDRVFDSKKISDHFAIIPTGEWPHGALEGDDARIFDLVVRRFLAAFLPPAVWAKVERITRVGSHSFRTRAQDLQEPGWREAYGLDTEEESSLPRLDSKGSAAATAVRVENFDHKENLTKPLPRLSEARLLSLMEHCGKTVEDENLAAALNEKGIGTPATRADIIENLISKEYVTRSGRVLKPSAKGIRLIDVLTRIPVPGLSSVELTGEMEYELKQVERGQSTRKKFMKNMADFATEVVEKAKTMDFDVLYAKETPLGACPKCKHGHVRESFWGYACQNKPSCDFIIWKEKNYRYVDRSLVTDLLAGKKLGELEFANAAGVPYLAKVSINERGLVLLDENGNPLEPSLPSEASILNEFPLEKTFLQVPGKVIETSVAYLCEFGGEVPQQPSKPTKSLKAAAVKTKAVKATASKAKRVVARMPKLLCSRSMSLDDFKEYVITGSTPVITDFKSKKGRPFAARLSMKPNGSFEFKFESLKGKAKNSDNPDGQAESGDAAKKAPPRKKTTVKKAKVVKTGT